MPHSYTIDYKKPDSTTLTASKGVGKALTDLVALLVHGFIDHINLPRSKQFLDTAVAQGKMVVPPDGVIDDCVQLVCSKNALTRLGVLNETERVLERGVKEGSSEILIQVTFEGQIGKVASVLRN